MHWARKVFGYNDTKTSEVAEVLHGLVVRMSGSKIRQDFSSAFSRSFTHLIHPGNIRNQPPVIICLATPRCTAY